MTGILLVAQFVLAAILTIAVLLQKSSSIGLGAYSGSNESLFGAKGPAGFLAKFTFGIGLIFIINTLALGYLYNTAKSDSIVEQIETTIPTSGESKLPQAPQAPKAD
ncbi:MAG: preprotein translocase subunit SecG [Campylobacteraceae bacterium]|nr:preprotein translocase subunit SecG [Campylobacteraceae bacterium]